MVAQRAESPARWPLVQRLLAAGMAVLAAAIMAGHPGEARSEGAGSGLRAFQQGLIDLGGDFSCAIVNDGTVRCWGLASSGRLGYGNVTDIGDTETPASAGAVDLGPGRTARSIATGKLHACAILDNGTVRCWGDNLFGQLGYPGGQDIGDGELPSAAGPVDLGPGRTARAIAAGEVHTCAILDDGNVRCWGNNSDGQLGYPGFQAVGDNESPATVGPVDLGPARTARAITAGGTLGSHTCAILDDSTLRCWGYGPEGQLGNGTGATVGDDETPGSRPPVALGVGRTARAVSAGYSHTCVILDDGNVRCFGKDFGGELGIPSSVNIGDTEPPDSVPVVNLGPGRTATAISAGGAGGDFLGHTCAILDDGTVRCWGFGLYGQLGYAATANITGSPTGAVNIGSGRTARAIATGTNHTCVLMDTGALRCWGENSAGQLGHLGTTNIGDTEPPANADPPDLGRPLVANVADLSVGVALDVASGSVDQQVRATVTLANSGPDSVAGVSVNVPVPGGLLLDSSAPSLGTYSGVSGVWSVGTLGPGATATLDVVLRASAAGSFGVTAEVAAAGEVDPDSTPGNGAVGEDDRGTALFSATALPPGPAASPPPPNATPVVRLNPRVRFRIAFGKAAQVLSLNVLGVPRGARVEMRCRKQGCRLRKATIATGRTVRFAALFKNRTLRRGTVIEIRVTRAGTIGRFFRYTIGARKVAGIECPIISPAGKLGRCAPA